jgi:hypothetical protein
VGRLSKRMVEEAEVRTSEYVLWDGDIPGFGVRVIPSGLKGYLVQYRVGTRSRKLALGPHGVLTVDQARARAIQALADVKGAGDPAEVRKERREAITVRELSDRFDREHIAVRVKESTAREYGGNLKRFILPALGRLRVTDVGRADVAKFHHSLRHIPYQANRNLEIVSKMFSLAEMWGLRPDGSNPRKHLAKCTENKRERFLSAAELKRLGETLNEMEAEGIESPGAITGVRLLLVLSC